MRTFWQFCLVCACVLGLSASIAFGQQVSDRSWVSGTGTQSLSLPADTLRMHISILAKGANFKEALQQLKERRLAALTTLETLGAIKDTVQVGDATINQEMAQQQAQLNAMIRERMAGRTRNKKGGENSGTVYLTASLQADWKLNASDTDGLLLIAYDIREKVKAADLAGTKDTSKLSPEEEELQAEMAQYRGYGNEQQPGQAQFVFVGRISPAQYQKLQADAFAKSKEAAEKAAQLASLKLGKLINVQVNERAGVDNFQYQYARYAQMAGGIDPSQLQEELGNPHEAVSQSPSKVTFRAAVTSTYLLE